jgi:hypothetical protein
LVTDFSAMAAILNGAQDSIPWLRPKVKPTFRN